MGSVVSFIYDNIHGEFKIIKYCDGYLYIKYLEKDIFKIFRGNLIRCKLGNLLELYTDKYKYVINSVIDTNNRKIKIIETARNKHGHKIYVYKCLVCGSTDKIPEASLIAGNGCGVCNNKKIIVGHNDMWTTSPKLASLLLNPKDGHNYTKCSAKKVDWKCSVCGKTIKNKMISTVYINGLSCPACSDGISFPEKIMHSVLSQLNVNFITQLSKKSFKWCLKYRYDFYIEAYNLIIETHGMQHYKDRYNISTEIIQENDKNKMNLALKNNILNYIVVDCRYSDLDYIKENILKSSLSEIFNLSIINWKECLINANNSSVKEACDLWNSGIKSTAEIGKILNMHISTIISYLKRGVNIGWCDYAPNVGSKRRVICLNNLMVFNSIKDAAIYVNMSSSLIILNLKGRSKSAGKHPETGEPLVWMYYEDWLKQQPKT